ncbi:MAG: metal-dependent hydrolase [Candidatus Thorarchaeota archaeon]
MDLFTHLVFGALMYILCLKDVAYNYLLLAIIFSILPDLDIFLTPLKKIIKSNYLEHRGGSHSYIIGIIISSIGGILYSLITQQAFFIAWIISMVFYSLHVSMDLLTTTKIPYLYPLSKREYCFYAEKAGSFFTMLNSITFLILLGILFYSSANLFLFSLLINSYTYFFIIYYLYRIISKSWFSSKLKNNQKYLPGILPFYYTIYDHDIKDNEVSLALEKRSHFSNTIEIKNFNMILDSEELFLFKKGIELCKKDYYYAKWTLFPIFIKNQDIFSIRFFFLETMMSKRTMCIEFSFSKSTQELISFQRGSGRIQT